MKIIDYTVIRKTSIKALEDGVTELMKDSNWRPVGGVALERTARNGRTVFYQAMAVGRIEDKLDELMLAVEMLQGSLNPRP